MNDMTMGSITFGPATKQAPNSYALLDEKAQAEAAYFKALYKHLVMHLAERYRNGEYVAVAHLCDGELDHSGRLLGEVRDLARS